MKKLPHFAWWMILYAVLIGTALWAYSTWSASQSEIDDAQNAIQECRQLASKITKLRGKPLRAASEAHSATELARVIEKSAQSAQLPATSLVQIDPQPARRIGTSPYSEQATHLEIRNVTLRQLIAFLRAIVEDQSGCEVAELRLRAPRDEPATTPETWQAEITLSHLIYGL